MYLQYIYNVKGIIMIYTEFTLSQAKIDYKLNRLTHWRILKIFNVYTITLYTTGGQSGTLIDHRDKSQRTFKNITSAINTLQSIGFDCNIIQMGTPQ